MTTEVTDGTCSCCGAGGEVRGAERGAPACTLCTYMLELAPQMVANLLSYKLGSVVEVDGDRIDLVAPHASRQLARKLTERYRKLGPDALTDWSGAVRFPELDERAVATTPREA